MVESESKPNILSHACWLWYVLEAIGFGVAVVKVLSGFDSAAGFVGLTNAGDWLIVFSVACGVRNAGSEVATVWN